MRYGLLLGPLLFAAALGAREDPGKQILLDQQTDLQITERGDFGNAQGRLRELLSKYLLLALNREELTGPGDTVTFVIEARAQSESDIPAQEIKDLADLDAFEIEILAGPQKTVRISGPTVLGAGFGVMHFLERHLGVFWALPGELGLCLPENNEFRLTAVRERVAAAFVSRACTGFVYRDDAIDRSQAARSGVLHDQRAFFFGYDYFKNLRLHALASPSHNMIHVVPPELKATDPEIFPVQDGKPWFPPERDRSRKGAGGAWQAWHPCYTNPRTVEIAAAKARAAFEQGQLCFSLGINDGRRVQCQCPECRRVGFPRSYYQFVQTVAERTRDFYPPHLIGLIAYGDVREPPPDLNLPENVLVMVVSGGPEASIRWAEHAQILGTYEHFPGQGFWIPNIPLAAMESNARFYRQHGIRFYRAEIYPLWAFDAPRVWLLARLLWDPDYDLDAGLRRFCDAAFGRAGEPMCRFYRRWAELRAGDVVPEGVTPLLGRRPERLWLDPARQFHACSAADFDDAADCISLARSLVEEGRARERLEMVAAFFDYSRTSFDAYHLAKRMFDADAPAGARDRIAAALRLREKHRGLLREMHDHPEWFLGTSAHVDDDLVPSWEERSTVALVRMLESAIIADCFRLNENEAPAPEVPPEFRKFQRPFHKRPQRVSYRRSHAWYADTERFVPLQVASDRDAVRLTATATDQRSEHPRWLGERKHHWAALMVRNLPTGGRNLCLIDLDAAGRNGRLVIRASLSARNAARREVMLIEPFGPEERTVHKRLAIEPALFPPKNSRNRPPAPTDATATIQIYLTWEPTGDHAPLQARLWADDVDFDPAE